MDFGNMKQYTYKLSIKLWVFTWSILNKTYPPPPTDTEDYIHPGFLC